jgi:lipoprotein-releasing system ATP-binding protein
MMNDNEPILACSHLTKTYQDGERSVEVLKDVSFSITAGEIVAIMGASGSGKSTLLHLLGGLDKPTSGIVTLAGNNMQAVSEKQQGILRNHHLGFVYQFHHLLPEMNALENVAMPLLIRGEAVRSAREKATELLEKVGLAERMLHRHSQLSGGERQRVALARALVTQPQCVLADEPTGNLDAKTADSMLNLLMDMNTQLNIAFVVVTHDSGIAARMHKRYSITSGTLAPLQ